MSLLFHIMSFIDTDGPVGLAAPIDKQLSGLILEGEGDDGGVCVEDGARMGVKFQ